MACERQGSRLTGGRNLGGRTVSQSLARRTYMKKHWNAELTSTGMSNPPSASIAILREAGEQIDELKKGFQGGGTPRATRGHGMGNRGEGEQRDELDRVQRPRPESLRRNVGGRDGQGEDEVVIKQTNDE